MVALDDPAVRKLYADEEPLPRMSFGDHLDELRRRLIRSLLVLIVAIVVVSIFKSEVQGIVVGPYRAQWTRGFENWEEQLQAQSDAGTLDEEGREFLAYCRKYHDEIVSGDKKYKNNLPMKTGYGVPYLLMTPNPLDDVFNWMWASVLFAFVIASPYVVWQAWAFIAAGLYQKEKRLFHRYFPFMVSLFAAGVLFGYFVVLPMSLGILIRLMDADQVMAWLSLANYFTLLFTMTCALGFLFQLPLVMVALQRVGLVPHQTFVKHWRITVLVIFFTAALFTPPEPISMLMAAGPMLILYLLGLVLTWMWRRNEAPQLGAAA